MISPYIWPCQVLKAFTRAVCFSHLQTTVLIFNTVWNSFIKFEVIGNNFYQQFYSLWIIVPAKPFNSAIRKLKRFEKFSRNCFHFSPRWAGVKNYFYIFNVLLSLISRKSQVTKNNWRTSARFRENVRRKLNFLRELVKNHKKTEWWNHFSSRFTDSLSECDQQYPAES